MKHFITTIVFFSIIILTSCNKEKKNEPSNTTTTTTTPTIKKDYTLGSVTDICGNKYTYINFNGKTWMAQNMRCNKYDTKSEQSGKTLSTSTKNYAPCYIDASAKYNWDEESKKNGTNLTDEQILQLGYLYSWSAAVGLKSYDEAKEKTYFSYTRQGICPNGWHIPTKSDWVESETNGKKLKSTTGWYNGDSEYKAGSDSYGFSALPAGYCSVSSSGSNYIKDLGTYAYFWTVDPEVTTGILGYKNSSGAFARLMGYSYDELFSISHTKTAALSVRCVKDEYQMSKVNLSLDKTEISIQVKTNTTITATTNTTDEIVWTTSNANIATIKIDGKKCTINGIAVGEVEIKAEVAGVEAVCKVKVLSRESQSSLTLNDVCGNTYNYVKIGSQYWMAENMRCNKYDTQSERAGATISTTNSGTCAPYYADASNKSLWKSTGYAKELTDTQIAKLGFLYNWAAAVGIATAKEAETQVSNFRGNRQGICPNGWHIPTSAEWDALGIALENSVSDLRCFNKTGDMLRTTSGWFAVNGTDECSFAALPAGIIEAGKTTIDDVGFQTFFWTATPESKDYANYLFLHVSLCSAIHKKGNAYSVRCVKN